MGYTKVRNTKGASEAYCSTTFAHLEHENVQIGAKASNRRVVASACTRKDRKYRMVRFESQRSPKSREFVLCTCAHTNVIFSVLHF